MVMGYKQDKSNPVSLGSLHMTTHARPAALQMSVHHERKSTPSRVTNTASSVNIDIRNRQVTSQPPRQITLPTILGGHHTVTTTTRP